MDATTSKLNIRGAVQNFKTELIALALLVLILIVLGGVLRSQANADYICTRIIEDSGTCSNGAWGPWEDVLSEEDEETNGIAIIQRRIYTGTRTLRHVIEYLNRRTSCETGYEQSYSGNTGGDSGFHGGQIITESQVCQVEENRTVYFNAEGDEIDTSAITSTMSSGENSEEMTTVSSLNEINDFRRANRDLGLSATPAIVTRGQSTNIRWTTVEMLACRVTSNKSADFWGVEDPATSGTNIASTAGSEVTSPIDDVTIYTLDCIDFEGNPMQETAAVHLVPEWEEF